jgi:hypothetical protein
MLRRRRRKDVRVNPVRGIVMIVAAAIAFWKGWQIHRGETAVLAYGLGAMALALGVWHLMRERRRTPAQRP